MTRADNLAAAVLRFDITRDPECASGRDVSQVGEDIPRYLAVTMSDTGTYYGRCFNTVGLAREGAVEYVDSGICPEFPIAIVDLDTGDTQRPAWDLLGWEAA